VFTISSDNPEFLSLWFDIRSSSLVFKQKNKSIIIVLCFVFVRIKINDDENERSMTNDRSMKVHKKSVRSVGFSPDGETILTVSKDKSIKLRSTETGKMITKYKRAHEFVHPQLFLFKFHSNFDLVRQLIVYVLWIIVF